MQASLRRMLYACVVFWSALLLLLVQPVLTKAILPWFGGSAGVWTTSMLFFQTVLLLGYLYAHLLHRTLALRWQILLHCALLVMAVLMLPLHPSVASKPSGGADPVPRILGLLFSSAGLPYFLLSATSPLLQSWFASTNRTELPWRLFAISNLGSLVALLSYPILIEPRLTVEDQLRYWSLGFLLFAVSCAATGLLSWRLEKRAAATVLPRWPRLFTWLGLAAVPSVLWLAVANQISQDVAAIPFLWILPLALYLLSFFLTFESDLWYRPRLYKWLLPIAWTGVLVVVAKQSSLHIMWTIVLYSFVLFLCCMFCHGELARLRPES
ncbi:MAG: hypothetical protein H7Y20_11550, partial [Bryobacteraceae bacterium]|nr:hypothetical protein [Bryobacteraceae bacterium]